MEVLGAVASAVALAEVALKGVRFLRRIPEIQDEYKELVQEVCSPSVFHIWPKPSLY
jgi:hypothetical protein